MRTGGVSTLAHVTDMNAHARRSSTCGNFIAAILWLVAAATLPNLSQAAEWPHFLGPNRNGSILQTNLAKTWPKEGPVLFWQHKVGEGFAGPVVSAGKLIVFHRAEDKEVVECLDAKTGKELWRGDYPARYRDDFGFEEGPRATPAIANGRVFTFGANGDFTAWDFAKGTKLWSVDTRAQFKTGKGFFGIACSPLVEGNAVILNIGGRDGAGVVAFDVASGKVLWQATDDEASYASPVAATLGGKRRLLVITREALVALEAADGRVVFRHAWRPPMSASVSAATPLVNGDLIFISASYGTGASLLRFKEGAPEVIWSRDEVLSAHYATAVQHKGFLYGFDGRQEQGCELRCVELKTGQVRWSERGLKAGIVTLANDQLLVLTDRGELIQAPASPTGFKASQRAQILPFVARAHPALADGFFYARSKDKLVCVDLRASGSPSPPAPR